MIKEVTIAEAAEQLSLPQATIRKQIKTGELDATKEPSAGGFRYKVLLDDNAAPRTKQGPIPPGMRPYERSIRAEREALEAQLTAKTDLIERFRLENEAQATELAARRQEIQQLHILLGQQTALNAARRSWWKIW